MRVEATDPIIENALGSIEDDAQDMERNPANDQADIANAANARQALEHELAAKYPNLSAYNLRQVEHFLDIDDSDLVMITNPPPGINPENLVGAIQGIDGTIRQLIYNQA